MINRHRIMSGRDGQTYTHVYNPSIYDKRAMERAIRVERRFSARLIANFTVASVA